MTTYRLASNGLCHTPGILAWAMNGYAFPRDRAKLTAVFVDGYGLPKPAAKARAKQVRRELGARGGRYTVNGQALNAFRAANP